MWNVVTHIVLNTPKDDRWEGCMVIFLKNPVSTIAGTIPVFTNPSTSQPTSLDAIANYCYYR